MQDKWNDGDAYEMYVGRWSRKTGREFLSWLNVPKGQRWLDLGCGTGALTSQILQNCAPESVIGVEPSENSWRSRKMILPMSGLNFCRDPARQFPSMPTRLTLRFRGLF